MAEESGNINDPGILRAILIREEEKEQEKIWKLESNIDDCTGENLGYVMERLMEAGARDVHYSAVYMKKNRPAWQLNVICTEESIPMLEQIIFEETTTIGIRKNRVERSVLKRTFDTVQISEGEAKVKLCQVPGRDGVELIQRCYQNMKALYSYVGQAESLIRRFIRRLSPPGMKKIDSR